MDWGGGETFIASKRKASSSFTLDARKKSGSSEIGSGSLQSAQGAPDLFLLFPVPIPAGPPFLILLVLDACPAQEVRRPAGGLHAAAMFV